MSWTLICSLTVVAAFCTGLSLILSPERWHETTPGRFILLSVPVQLVAAYLHIGGASADAGVSIWPLWLGISVLVSAVIIRPLIHKYKIEEIGGD